MEFRKPLSLKLALACALAVAFPASQIEAETCISPYVKALKSPEKVMYLWALPATPGEAPDFLAVIDVNLASPTYGKILKKVEVGSAGNEAHHIGYTDDRTKIWAASLNTSRLFIFDVSDPMNPVLSKTIDNVAQTVEESSAFAQGKKLVERHSFLRGLLGPSIARKLFGR